MMHRRGGENGEVHHHNMNGSCNGNTTNTNISTKIITTNNGNGYHHNGDGNDIDNRKKNTHVRLVKKTRRVRRKKVRSSGFSTFYGQHDYDTSSYFQLGLIALMLIAILGATVYRMTSSPTTDGSSGGDERNLGENNPFGQLRNLDKKMKEHLHHRRQQQRRRRRKRRGQSNADDGSDDEEGNNRKGGGGSWFGSIFSSNGDNNDPMHDGPNIYEIPGSMSHIGDKSIEYALLRKEYDTIYPPNAQRSLEAVKRTHKRSYIPMKMEHNNVDYNNNDDQEDDKLLQEILEQETYDVYNCPYEPPNGYPYSYNIMDVLKNWPPDDPKPRTHIYQGLCVFDYMNDLDKANNYRENELPFVLKGDPVVAATVERWTTPGYVDKLMSNVKHRTEYSINNHFMYWAPPSKKKTKRFQEKQRNGHARRRNMGIGRPNNWTAPTEMMRMEYSEWIKHANVSDEFLGPDQPHWYYRLIGCGEQGECDRGSSEYLFDELTFFQPTESIYITEPKRQKGIHCRFGMKGVIAENHFDGSRNMIVVLGGERRYILSHPNQCKNLALLPKTHPSGRHSAVDWSNPDLDTYPQFTKAYTNEIVLQAGDVLYLPTNWFHYIISLELNFQCNTRSGITEDYMEPIHKCGF